MENFSPSNTSISYHTDTKETPNTEGSSQIIFWLYYFEDLLAFKLLTLIFRSQNSLPSPPDCQMMYESYEMAVQFLLLITNALQPRPYFTKERQKSGLKKCENYYGSLYDYRKRISQKDDTD